MQRLLKPPTKLLLIKQEIRGCSVKTTRNGEPQFRIHSLALGIASVEVGAGDWSRKQVQGMVNIPFSDVVQLRIAGEAVRREGFEKNISPGPTPGRMNDARHESARVTLRITPSTRFTNDILADYFHMDQVGIKMDWELLNRPIRT